MILSRKLLMSGVGVLACCFVAAMVSSEVRAEEKVPATQASKLVIKKAVYGDLPDGGTVTVTEKVASMVKDDALSVVANNENFTDPAPGVVKKLKVDYTFEGKEKSKTVDEGETLVISNTGE